MPFVSEQIGDIFDAPSGSILLRKMGCWGSACIQDEGQLAMLPFASLQSGKTHTIEQFPAAFEIYRQHCSTPPTASHRESLLGTALLIPHQESDSHKHANKQKYWIACIFTSIHIGKRMGTKTSILSATTTALQDLQAQIQSAQEAGDEPGSVYSVRINSGLFKVPWFETSQVMKASGLSIVIVKPEGEG
ncbi:ADP-ribose 1''-phosphate phosphatase [Agyrium rufum]|nr:ADP-ribose 1''-phosphate phosphatase [Agyrium rufum]